MRPTRRGLTFGLQRGNGIEGIKVRSRHREGEEKKERVEEETATTSWRIREVSRRGHPRFPDELALINISAT